jgi:hypothetical protein
MLNTMDKLVSELQSNHSKLYSIQDHQTFGYRIKLADSQLLAIFTNILMNQRALLMLKTELTSTLHMVQVVLLDILEKIQLQLLVWQLRTHSSDKSLNLKVLALWLQSLMVF